VSLTKYSGHLMLQSIKSVTKLFFSCRKAVFDFDIRVSMISKDITMGKI